jgi:hypothetical protein
MKPAEFDAHILETANLELEHERLGEELKQRKAAIIAEVDRLGTAEVSASGGKTFKWASKDGLLSLAVSWPAPSIKVDASKIDQIRTVAGDAFAKLFTKVVRFDPVKSFRDVAAAVLTPAKAKKLVGMCEVAGAPRVKFTRREEA